MPGVPRGHPALGLITMNFAANGTRPGQRRHADRPEGDARAADAQPEPRHRHQRADPVPGAERLVADAAAGDDLHVPRAAGRGRPDAGVPADPAGHQRLDAGRPAVGGLRAAAAAVGPGGAGLPGCPARCCSAASWRCWRTLSAAALAALSSLLGNLALFGIILLFLRRRRWCAACTVYEASSRARRKASTSRRNLLPYLVAMLCAVGVLRASGALDARAGAASAGAVDAARLGHALRRRAADRAGQAVLRQRRARDADRDHAEPWRRQLSRRWLAATIQGSTETTFYVLAVYFGAVGIQRARHAVGCALLAELAGVVAAIAVCYWFFG